MARRWSLAAMGVLLAVGCVTPKPDERRRWHRVRAEPKKCPEARVCIEDGTCWYDKNGCEYCHCSPGGGW